MGPVCERSVPPPPLNSLAAPASVAAPSPSREPRCSPPVEFHQPGEEDMGFDHGSPMVLFGADQNPSPRILEYAAVCWGLAHMAHVL